MKKSHVDAIVAGLRRVHASDLLLPVGAALVAAGVEALADRERRQRERLAGLQSTMSQHIDQLLAAGVAVPEELLADEKHPFDAPGLAGVSAAVYGITDNPNPKTPTNSYPDGRRKGWKWRALALGAVAGVTFYHRGRIAEAVAPYLAELRAAVAAASVDEELKEMIADEPAEPWTGDRCERCGEPAAWFVDEQKWRHVVPTLPAGRNARWSAHVVVLPPAVNEAAPAPWDRAEPDPVKWPAHSHDYTAGESSSCSICGAPGVAFAGLQDPVAAEDLVDPAGEECGWESCTWTPKPSTVGAARVTALAVHRARCPYRPPSATVPGA